MSIIESAFLKTLQDSKKELNESEDIPVVKKEAGNKSISNNISESPSSSKAGISLMSQVRRFSQKEYFERRLISIHSGDRELLNEYRNLRTKLIASQNKYNFTTLVTSIVPDYDISHVTTNMAIAFALDSTKTSLVINADIYNNALENLLDVDVKLGMIDYLESENMPIEDILYETPVSRLRYIPTGEVREEQSEYFTSKRMKNLIDLLVNRYPERFPLIVAPSIGSSADTRILIDSCDCVVLVAPYGKCNESEIRSAMQVVGADKFAGIILDEF